MNSTHLSLATTSPTPAVSKYTTYLRKKYLRLKVPVRGKWPPSPCKKIIKLATIEKKEQYKIAKLHRLESVDEYMQENSMTPVSMEDLLKPKNGSPHKIVVIQGVPGIGKSTFAWKFCRSGWAKGKSYQEYDLVVLLRMRDTRVREATTLSDFLFSEDKELSLQVGKEVISCNGKGILLFIEGIDELPVSCLADGTLISDLFEGESLPDVTLVVTTRPWAVQMLTEKCGDQISRHVEILGFTNDDIVRYVSNAFAIKEKAEFLDYLHSHPQLESIMHIPLNAAFVVQIYKQFKRSPQAIPHTITQLYKALVEGLLLRYLKSGNEFNWLMSTDLESLPEPFKTHFEQLCLLAFMSFTKVSVQVTFTDSEAALYGCLDSLGLMQSSTDLLINTGTTVTHSFLHFTIQEFLAAYHLSKQPAQVQQLFLVTHKSDHQFNILIKFLIGLNCDVLYFLRESTSDLRLTTDQLHWLFESQSPMAVCKFLGNAAVEYYSFSTTSLDLYALSYCLCCSNCKWILTIDLKNLSSIFSSSNSFKGEIQTLRIASASHFVLKLMFSLPRHLFVGVSCFVVYSSHDIDSTVATILTNGLLPSLNEFAVLGLHSSLTVSATLNSVHSLFSGVKSILFGHCLFSSSDTLILCKYINSVHSSEFNVVLEYITFTENSLQMFISAVACSVHLSGVSLAHINLLPTDFEMLSVALSLNSALKCLELCGCSVDGEGAELLASGLEQNKTIEKVDLSENDIGVTGATALALMLEANTSLKKLKLCKNNLIGTRGALRLINALEQNKTLEELILPSECEPMEYGSVLYEHIKCQNRVYFA